MSTMPCRAVPVCGVGNFGFEYCRMSDTFFDHNDLMKSVLKVKQFHLIHLSNFCRSPLPTETGLTSNNKNVQ